MLFRSTILLIAAAYFCANAAVAKTFTCEFMQEEEPNGKSNEANCSGDPEQVFSTSSYTPPRSAHCSVDPVVYLDNYVDFRVDLTRATVTYTRVLGLPKRLIEAAAQTTAQREKIPLDQARRKVATRKEEPEGYKISSAYSYRVSDYFSPTTGEIITELAKVPTREVHVVHYGRTGEMQLLFPDDGGPASIISYSLLGRYSVVRARFGRCTAGN